VSLAVDASAVVSLHFEDESGALEKLESRLSRNEEAFTAPNFFQEVMEALRRGIREGRTNPCAASSTWLIAEQLNVSAYDAGYIAVAKSRGLPLWTRDEVVRKRAPRIGVKVKP